MKKNTKNNSNNKKVKKSAFPFFEKQGNNNMCRLHAINNALGRSIISKRQYDFFSKFVSSIFYLLCLDSLNIAMNLICITIAEEVENSSSSILMITLSVLFWTNFTYKIHIILQIIVLISSNNLLSRLIEKCPICFLEKIQITRLRQSFVLIMNMSGVLRNTMVLGLIWILCQTNHDESNFEVYFLDKSSDGSYFAIILNLYHTRNLSNHALKWNNIPKWSQSTTFENHHQKVVQNKIISKNTQCLTNLFWTTEETI